MDQCELETINIPTIAIMLVDSFIINSITTANVTICLEDLGESIMGMVRCKVLHNLSSDLVFGMDWL